MNNKALVSLSFDDGRLDNYKIFKEITIPRKLPVTLNVTTGYVDNTCPQEYKPSDKSAMTVEHIKELAANPYVEIALHGDNHLNSAEDISSGRLKLLQWLDLPEDWKFGFASPGSGKKINDFITSKDAIFCKDIIYMRTSLRLSTFKKIRILARKAGRVIHIPLFYRIAYKDTIMHNCPDRVIYSIPVMKDISYSQVKSIIDDTIKTKGTITLMFHSIVDDTSNEDNWSWEFLKFKKLCEYLVRMEKQGFLQVYTTKQLYESLI